MPEPAVCYRPIYKRRIADNRPQAVRSVRYRPIHKREPSHPEGSRFFCTDFVCSPPCAAPALSPAHNRLFRDERAHSRPRTA